MAVATTEGHSSSMENFDMKSLSLDVDLDRGDADRGADHQRDPRGAQASQAVSPLGYLAQQLGARCQKRLYVPSLVRTCSVCLWVWGNASGFFFFFSFRLLGTRFSCLVCHPVSKSPLPLCMSL